MLQEACEQRARTWREQMRSVRSPIQQTHYCEIADRLESIARRIAEQRSEEGSSSTATLIAFVEHRAP